MANASRKLVLSLITGAGIAFAASYAGGQASFPNAEGRDEVFRACSQCHGLQRLTNVRLTRSEWENALYDMIARGAIVKKDDLGTIRTYLMDSFAIDNQ